MTSCARNYSSTPGASSTRIAFGLQSYKLFFILVLQMPKISCIYRLKWHCFTMLQHLSAVSEHVKSIDKWHVPHNYMPQMPTAGACICIKIWLRRHGGHIPNA